MRALEVASPRRTCATSAGRSPAKQQKSTEPGQTRPKAQRAQPPPKHQLAQAPTEAARPRCRSGLGGAPVGVCDQARVRLGPHRQEGLQLAPGALRHGLPQCLPRAHQCQRLGVMGSTPCPLSSLPQREIDRYHPRPFRPPVRCSSSRAAVCSSSSAPRVCACSCRQP